MNTAPHAARHVKSPVGSVIMVGALVALSVAARLELLSVTTLDMTVYLVPWYERLARDPGALGDGFSNYPPAYLYLLKLLTLTQSWIPSATAIKLLSTAFDCVSAIVVYRMVRLGHPVWPRPALAAAAFFALPSVVLNSSAWGQADAIYTTFLLATVLFTLERRGFLALACFALALALKLQAVFLFPFVLVMTVRGALSWRWYVLLPLVNVVLAIPAVASGRSWPDVLSIYARQVDAFAVWSHSAPNPYLFVTAPSSATNTAIALAVGAALVGGWMLATSRIVLTTRAAELHAALASLTLLPYLLPRMHERYFYPADAMALPAAFITPALWVVLFLSQLSSTLTNGVYLLQLHATVAGALALISAFVLTSIEVWLLLRSQFGRGTRMLSPASLVPPNERAGGHR